MDLVARGQDQVGSTTTQLLAQCASTESEECVWPIIDLFHRKVRRTKGASAVTIPPRCQGQANRAFTVHAFYTKDAVLYHHSISY